MSNKHDQKQLKIMQKQTAEQQVVIDIKIHFIKAARCHLLIKELQLDCWKSFGNIG